MHKFHEWFIGKLSWAFTVITYLLSPRPSVPDPSVGMWEVTRGGGIDVDLLFGKALFGEWHVTYLVRYNDTLLWVDGAMGGTWIHPITEKEYETILQDPRKRIKEYHVRVHVDPTQTMMHTSIGPITCVLLAKRLIGLDRPGLVTARQLLNYLWRNQDGRYNPSRLAGGQRGGGKKTARPRQEAAKGDGGTA